MLITNRITGHSSVSLKIASWYERYNYSCSKFKLFWLSSICTHGTDYIIKQSIFSKKYCIHIEFKFRRSENKEDWNMHQVLSMKRSQTSVKNHMTQSMRMRQQGQNKGRMNVSFLQNVPYFRIIFNLKIHKNWERVIFEKLKSNMLKVSFIKAIFILNFIGNTSHVVRGFSPGHKNFAIELLHLHVERCNDVFFVFLIFVQVKFKSEFKLLKFRLFKISKL